MIEYDYTLERDYGKESVVFKPGEIPTKLPNLVYIEGPNSSGKSTLLHIMALGLHGLKKDKLNPALRDKMTDLVNSGHQKLMFTFTLTDGADTLCLESNKPNLDDPQILLEETIKGGKTTLLTPDLFHRRYNLIYDIPDNPTERLKQLVHEIRENQKMYGNRLGALRNHVLTAITCIRGGRDPAHLKELEKNIEEGKRELSESEKDLKSRVKLLEQIERYSYSRLFLSELSRFEETDRELTELERKMKSEERKTKRVNSKFKSLQRRVRDQIDTMKETKRQISSRIEPYMDKDERRHLKIWDKMDLDSAFEDFEIPAIFETEVLALLRIVMKRQEKESGKTEIAEAKVLSDLIEFLGHYRNSDVVLPGVDRTVDEFLSVLESHYSKYEETKTKMDGLNWLMENLNKLRDDRRDVNKELVALQSIKARSDDSDGELEDNAEDLGRIESLRNRLESIGEACDLYKVECRKRGIDEGNLEETVESLRSVKALEPYMYYDDKHLTELIDDCRAQVVSKDRELKGKQSAVDLWNKEHARLMKLEPHKYESRLEDLDDLLERIKRLEGLLSQEFNTYIDCIMKNGVGRKNTKPESEYFDAVSDYLGRKVGYVLHIQKEYKVDKIDLVEGYIHTDGGIRIKLTDMGTGQSQSAYLTGLLNTDDKRKIIAIFDEVAAMDERSLERIFERFRKMHDEGRLLAGIVVQKAEAVKVIPKY